MTQRIACNARLLRQLLVLLSVLAGTSVARGEDLPEYKLKAEYLYRFAQFTEWPVEVSETINLCVHGADPFGAALDNLQGKTVEHRTIAVVRNVKISALDGCQIVFVASAAAADVPEVLEKMKGRPALIVADTPGAARLGVALNMAVVDNHVTFEANIEAAHAAHINLSSRLLRFATEVIQ